MQLSDFGLAVWLPTNSFFQTHSDVVGTFGYVIMISLNFSCKIVILKCDCLCLNSEADFFSRYLAPEYFMYGKVSNKIDVYAYGVVLLELLTGRKPICDENPKGQESLVMWVRILSVNFVPKICWYMYYGQNYQMWHLQEYGSVKRMIHKSKLLIVI